MKRNCVGLATLFGVSVADCVVVRENDDDESGEMDTVAGTDDSHEGDGYILPDATALEDADGLLDPDEVDEADEVRLEEGSGVYVGIAVTERVLVPVDNILAVLVAVGEKRTRGANATARHDPMTGPVATTTEAVKFALLLRLTRKSAALVSAHTVRVRLSTTHARE